MVEDSWNSRNAECVLLDYSLDTEWIDTGEFSNGREGVSGFLARKWQKELSSKLKCELWSFNENRIAVRFEYEYHDGNGKWFRAYGSELWEFDQNGLMQKRFASFNDLPIEESARKFKVQIEEGAIVIPDECGDTLWDNVLEEAEKREELKRIFLGGTDKK
jgi:nuclear transport factor 2 (NTF2) superfamily protein